MNLEFKKRLPSYRVDLEPKKDAITILHISIYEQIKEAKITTKAESSQIIINLEQRKLNKIKIKLQSKSFNTLLPHYKIKSNYENKL